jgi:orotate phosphoribosyltransferase-like protein
MGRRGPAPTFDYTEAQRLRDAGWTHRAIADELGVGVDAVRVALQRVRAEANRPAPWWDVERTGVTA